MGLFDQLFPYGSDQEAAAAIKDEDSLPPKQRRGLLAAMKMDTGKYIDKRSRAQKEAEALAAQQAAQINRVNNYGGIASFTTDQAKAPYNPPMADPAQAQAQQVEGKPYPSNFDDWDFWQKMDILTSDKAGDAYEKTKLPYGGDMRSPKAYQKIAADQKATQATPAAPKEMLPEPTPTQPAVDPQQQMIEDIKRQRAMLDAIYPQRQTDNPTQTQADDYGLDARERANQMAQLAFFAGITKGAGGSWVGVGEGLAAAGAAHDTGFQRYQQALQDKATRAKSANDTAYSDDAARTNAAVNLYSEDKKLDVARAREANDQSKDRIKSIDDYFKTTEPKMSGDYPDPEKEKAWLAWKRMYDISRDRGSIVSSADDVR